MTQKLTLSELQDMNKASLRAFIDQHAARVDVDTSQFGCASCLDLTWAEMEHNPPEHPFSFEGSPEVGSCGLEKKVRNNRSQLICSCWFQGKRDRKRANRQ